MAIGGSGNMGKLTRVKVHFDSGGESSLLDGVQKRCLVAVPADADLVDDLARHLSSRLPTSASPRRSKEALQQLFLFVDGFALQGEDRLQDVIRDGDVVVARPTTPHASAVSVRPLELATPPCMVRCRSRSAGRRQRLAFASPEVPAARQQAPPHLSALASPSFTPPLMSAQSRAPACQDATTSRNP